MHPHPSLVINTSRKVKEEVKNTTPPNNNKKNPDRYYYPHLIDGKTETQGLPQGNKPQLEHSYGLYVYVVNSPKLKEGS